MSTEQPEALRLADALDALLGYRGINADVGKAAVELRRLHLVNTELLEALRICEGNIISLLESSGYAEVHGEWFDVVQAAIAKVKGDKE
jgi:hypothetical protein